MRQISAFCYMFRYIKTSNVCYEFIISLCWPSSGTNTIDENMRDDQTLPSLEESCIGFCPYLHLRCNYKNFLRRSFEVQLEANKEEQEFKMISPLKILLLGNNTVNHLISHINIYHFHIQQHTSDYCIQISHRTY